MTDRRTYRTRQGEAIMACLAGHGDRYLSVDEVWADVSGGGSPAGRSTVYRHLEAMTQRGEALKATAPGGEARYRIATGATAGQLVCLDCGRAYPLDCHMVGDFSQHVLADHGFRIEPARTVLYGHCASCMATGA